MSTSAKGLKGTSALAKNDQYQLSLKQAFRPILLSVNSYAKQFEHI